MNDSRLVSSVVIILFLALAVSAGYANQPVNPSFELGTVGSVPDGWTLWSGSTKNFVKTNSTPQAPAAGGVTTTTYPFAYDAATDGSHWAGLWFALGESAGLKGCIYQQVAVPALSSGTVSVDVSVWNNGDIYDTQIFFGVDPNGGTDPLDPGVYWIERWEIQWPDAPPGNGDHIWWKQSIPRPGAGSAVGALAAWGGYNSNDAPIQATGSVITLFLYNENKWNNRESVIRFDNVQVHGDWATPVALGTPPEITDLSTPADGVIREVSVAYTLTDGEDADADANLAVAYQVGSSFDDSGLFSLETYALNSVGVSASSEDGNGTGTGNVRLVDVAVGNVGGGGSSTTIDAGVLSMNMLGSANKPYIIQTKVTDMDLGTSPYSGAGIIILPRINPTANGNPYFAVTLYRDNMANVLRVQMKSSNQSFSSSADLWGNLPTDGNSPIYLRARRGANGDWRGDYSLNGTQWLSAGLNDPSTLAGTPIDYDQDLTVGLFVQNGCTANFDYVTSGFLTATSAGWGDGKTGLASTSAGVPHIFAWDAPLDLGLSAFSSRVQLRLTGSDDDGAGDPVTTGFFQFAPNSATNAGNWWTYR